MEKVKSFLSSHHYLRIVALIMAIFWLLAFLSQKAIIDANIFTILENAEILFIGIVCVLLLTFFKNSFYVIPWVILTPFVFSHPFDTYSVPFCLYISVGLLVLGFIINFIHFKPKLKFGNYGFGLMTLGLAMILGGIAINSDFLITQVTFMLFAATAFIIVYFYLSSTIETEFEMVARLMTYLGIYLVFQLSVYFLIQESPLHAMLAKQSDVGWGISNNIALMLLFTAPFTLYLALSKEKFKCGIYIAGVALQFLGIIFTYSRGSIISMIIGFVLLVPLSIWKAKDKKALWISSLAILGCLALAVIVIYKYKHSAFEKFIDVAFKIDWSTLNGRSPIYTDIVEALKEHPVFGKGVFSLFNTSEAGSSYSWGHSTILQTVQTMGIFGVIALLIHMFEKYIGLLRKPKLWKTTIIFGFGLSDLYGLFDVSYYFINYMVVLILVLCMIDKLVATDLKVVPKVENNEVL